MCPTSVRKGHLDRGWEVEVEVRGGSTCGVTAVLLIRNRWVDEIRLTITVEIGDCDRIGDVGSKVGPGGRRPTSRGSRCHKADIFHVSVVENHSVDFSVSINVSDIEIIGEFDVHVDDARSGLRSYYVEVVGCWVRVCQAGVLDDGEVIAVSRSGGLTSGIINTF